MCCLKFLELISVIFSQKTIILSRAFFGDLAVTFWLKTHKMKGLLGREKLSLPLDPYATATDWISPLSFRNFRANPAALRFAAGRDMLQNCSSVAPKFNPSPALGGSIGRDNLRLGTLFCRNRAHFRRRA